MLIDWFTVAAQAVNFLILMWLLKRFLYKPILDAIAAREKNIADKLADASAKKAEAQKEQDDFRQKNEAFDKQKSELINNAKKEAEESRQQLLKEVQTEAEAIRTKRKEALRNEEDNLTQEIVQRTRQEVFALTAKVLHDLADSSLEEEMSAVFIRHLQSLTDEEKYMLSSSPVMLITSAFALSQLVQDTIKAAIKEISGTDKLQFKIVPELISGIELSLNGHKLAWSITDYLATLEKTVAESMAEKAGQEPAHAA